MTLSSYGKREWMSAFVIGLVAVVASLAMGWWPLAIVALLAVFAVACFFRDPTRQTPSQRGAVVSPADGRVSSVHRVEHFEPFDGPATCVRVFMSLLDVHVNRSPCHGLVESIRHKDGKHINALNPESAEVNESNLVVLTHPAHGHPVAAVRQVAGVLARKIVCGVTEEQIVQRGQRIGLIKFGSTTELYLPDQLQPQVVVKQGQRVQGGVTILAHVATPLSKAADGGGAPNRTASPDKQPVGASK